MIVRAALARLRASRAAAPKATLAHLCNLAPLDAKWLDDVGEYRANDNYLLRWCGDDRTRRALRILSGRDNLREAQAYNADHGATVREDWTASRSRGDAIVAGEKTFFRAPPDDGPKLGAYTPMAQGQLDVVDDARGEPVGLRREAAAVGTPLTVHHYAAASLSTPADAQPHVPRLAEATVFNCTVRAVEVDREGGESRD